MPPVQLEPFHAAVVQLLPSHGCPKMSVSPSSLTPSCSRICEPRAALSDPVPVDGSQVWATPPSEGVRCDRAARRSSVPAPSARSGAFGRRSAVSVRIAFTWSGLSHGRWSSKSAVAPETTAAACEVPLPRKNRESPTRPPGAIVSMPLPGTRRLTIDLPGATRSGFLSPSPALDHAGTSSSCTLTVPLGLLAPTAITYGSYAGLLSLALPNPAFPPATTTTMPLRHATSVA